MKTNLAITLFPALASATLLQGAIVLENASIANDFDGGTSGTVSFSQSAAGDATYLFAVYGENLAGASAPSVIYDDGGTHQSATLEEFASVSNSTYAAVFSLELGSVSAGTIDITFDNNSTTKNMFDIYQLSGASGASLVSDAVASPGDASVAVDFGSVPAPDSFALFVAAEAGNSGSLDAPTGGTSPTVTLNDSGSYLVGSLYDLADATQAYSWGRDKTNDMAGAAIAVSVPEPSTYAVLFGIGALGIVLWRRRRAA